MRVRQTLQSMLVAVLLSLSIVVSSQAFSIIDTGTTSGGNPGGQTIYNVTGLVAGDTFSLTWGGVSGLSVDGVLTINTLDANSAAVAVVLTNNSTPIGSNGDPRITSFGLSVGGLTGFGAGTPGTSLTAFDNSNFPGFQDVVVCATSGSNCAGGGSGGIDVNLSDSFIFALTGNFASGLNLDSFALKIQGGPNGNSFELAGTPGEFLDTPVPEPGSAMLLGSGLVVLGFLAQRKNH